MKKNTNGCAIIEIGSAGIKMGIFQLTKGKVECLDRLYYPLGLGHEIFNFGRLTFSTLNELTSVLGKFHAACAGFGIDDIYVHSTSVMREAENSALISDRVLTQNGLEIRVLSEGEEKSLIYHSIISGLEPSLQNAVIAYVGSGTIGIACVNAGLVVRSYNIALGSLKLNDILGRLRNEMNDYHVIIEEYLQSVLKKLEFGNCGTLILTGTEMEQIGALCKPDKKSDIPSVSGDSLKRLYNEIKGVTADNIAVRFGLDEDSANVMSTTLCIADEIINFAGKPQRILVPFVDNLEIIAKQKLVPSVHSSYENHIRLSSVKSAELIAEKYKCNAAHSGAVSRIVCQLFDKLKKLHGLDEHYRTILEMAATLHSCGQYVNVKQRTKCSFDLIKNMDIYGMNLKDMRLIAYVSGYNEFNIPDNGDVNFRLLDSREKLIITKLVAIFRLANALDKSQKSKITIEKLKVEEEFLIIKASASCNAFLEEWAFNECADFFMDAFGIKPRLTVRSELI